MARPAVRSEVFVFAPPVAGALRDGIPVVALESAVISHGLPHPTGLETAAMLEDEVRRGGAVPATVAVLDGRIVVGASLEAMTQLIGPDAMKVAERDLAVAVAKRAEGGTTVSATIAVAAQCGIDVMSTGGIGGVHLGADQTWDVSADLPALARHSVLVVCAGAKAICDVAKTLEYLETMGVTVVGYQTGQFPYFYARESGLPVPQRVDTPEEAAAILTAGRALGRRGAVLVAQPIPASDALAPALVERAVADAIRRTGAVRGGDVTPALLAALGDLTDGRTVRANLALLRANASLAASIAAALHRKDSGGDGR